MPEETGNKKKEIDISILVYLNMVPFRASPLLRTPDQYIRDRIKVVEKYQHCEGLWLFKEMRFIECCIFIEIFSVTRCKLMTTTIKNRRLRRTG